MDSDARAYPAAKPRPGGGRAVPDRDAACCDPARAGECSAHVNIRAAHGNGIDIVVHAAAERRPGRAVPDSDVVCRMPARAGERSAHVDVRAAHGNGIDSVVQPTAEPGPGAAQSGRLEDGPTPRVKLHIPAAQVERAVL